MNEGFDNFKHGVTQHISHNSNSDSNYILYICVGLLIVLIIYLLKTPTTTIPKRKKKQSLNFKTFYDFNVWILKNLNFRNKNILMTALIKEGIYDLIQILEWESFDLISKSLKDNNLNHFVQIIAKRRAVFIKKIRQTKNKELRKLINEMRVFTLDDNCVLMLGSPRDQSSFMGMIKNFNEQHTQVFDVRKSGELIKTLRGTYMKVVFLDQRLITSS